MPSPLGLPDFPWDTIADARATAAAHPGGIVDLSVGTPVDPTPELVQEALHAATDSPGYPLVVGTVELRTAIRNWLTQRGLVDPGDTGVVPTTGSKEMVAWIPIMLGIGPGDVVLVPDVAYPTYEVGALLAGASPVPVDQGDVSSWPETADMVWLNSPSNPTGAVLTESQLRQAVEWARANGAIVVSDECYAELPWVEAYAELGIPSLLEEGVSGGDLSNLLMVYSLSKQSNMAGYRAAFAAGDPRLIQELVEVRKHGGMMVPAPVQAAMVAALGDAEHVSEQRERYRCRREMLMEALQDAGLTPDGSSEAGLYLWVPTPADWSHISDQSRGLLDWFASRGILVAPGDFYGDKGVGYVRVALTASDERVAEACRRLRS